MPQVPLIGGDRRSVSIAAASIVAKVYRDLLMESYHDLYPVYDFRHNRGYATEGHQAALKLYGPSPIHRRSFEGVDEPMMLFGGTEPMAIQRDKVIASAEKLVAKGKIEPAIKEYERLLDDNPNDVNTLNRIGDLWVRINRNDEAVKVFGRIADHYSRDGFFLKAIAIYKKINKLDPSKLEIYAKLADLYAQAGAGDGGQEPVPGPRRLLPQARRSRRTRWRSTGRSPSSIRTRSTFTSSWPTSTRRTTRPTKRSRSTTASAGCCSSAACSTRRCRSSRRR